MTHSIKLGQVYKENDKRFNRYVKVCAIVGTRIELCAGASPNGPWTGKHTHSNKPERFTDKPVSKGYTLVQLKPKYAIVYANQFRNMRGDTVTTGQVVETASDLKEAKSRVKAIFDQHTDIITVIDLETGLQANV